MFSWHRLLHVPFRRLAIYPIDANSLVSHETIYRSLYIQARGALKKELLQHLKRPRVMRRSRHHTQKTDNHGRILDTVSISERPATVEDRAVPGHWEGDLLCGDRSSQISTLDSPAFYRHSWTMASFIALMVTGVAGFRIIPFRAVTD
jgi:IS30 family transposase